MAPAVLPVRTEHRALAGPRGQAAAREWPAVMGQAGLREQTVHRERVARPDRVEARA